MRLMWVVLLLVFLLLLGPLCQGQQMTHEEEVIRTTYAKLSYNAPGGTNYGLRTRMWPTAL
jgi:hypothetical protein